MRNRRRVRIKKAKKRAAAVPQPFCPKAALGELITEMAPPEILKPCERKSCHPQCPLRSLKKSAAEAQLEADELSKSIYQNYCQLQYIILRHEMTIRRRWTKKRKQQRLDVLLRAWPGMSQMHRPDFHAYRQEASASRHKPTAYMESYMWPYINQEDLLEPKALLLFLNARGRHPPSMFAAADGEAMHLGKMGGSLVLPMIDSHIMMLNGIDIDNFGDYGRLVSTKEDRGVHRMMSTRRQVRAGEGLLILKAQDRVLSFLTKCCVDILRDFSRNSLTAGRLAGPPEPLCLLMGAAAKGPEFLSVMAAEAPYRVPAHLDLGRIEALLRARTAAAEDHLWALREDAGYFVDHLYEVREHRGELVPDSEGNQHSSCKSGWLGEFGSRILSIMAGLGHQHVDIFSELSQQAQDLQALQKKHAAAISPDKELPDEFLTALLRFRYYLVRAAQRPIGMFRYIVCASPPMRKFFERNQMPPEVGPLGPLFSMNHKYCEDTTKTEAFFLWLLRTLCQGGRQLYQMSVAVILDELERVMANEPRVKNLMSSYVAQTIGSLSLVSQCLSQLELYKPWAQSFNSDMRAKRDAIRREYEEHTEPWHRLDCAFGTSDLSKAARLCVNFDNKAAYLTAKRRNKEETESLRRAEQNLDAIWAIIDSTVAAKCGSLKGTSLGAMLSQKRTLQRTPEWVAEPARPQAAKPDVNSIYKPLSTLYISRADKPGQVQEQQQPGGKAKKEKTRGKPSPPDGAAADAAAAAAAEMPGPAPDPRPEPIAVDRRALRVFRNLFFNPDVTSTPGEIAWSDFIYALTSTGMFSAEKLYGSAWQFQRIDGVEGGNIQFHEPHPRHKIPFTRARHHGRRLNRNFGWDGDTFVLREGK